LEAVVREVGRDPATIAIIDGVLRVGLEDDELAADRPEESASDVKKISTRDIPIAVATSAGTARRPSAAHDLDRAPCGNQGVCVRAESEASIAARCRRFR
jgi:pseudouridine-5'-phosphate glycosidase